ncbi:MAG: DegT/DnrJ/EryC1/StrS family aminotransferase [Actinomycetes bacterium]
MGVPGAASTPRVVDDRVIVDIRGDEPIVTTARAVPFLNLAALHAQVEDEIIEAWRGILRSAAFIGGEAVRRYEERLAGYLGVPAVVGVGNGTDAITLALLALGVGPGDEVIAPANTFVATIEAIIHAGATPVLADVDPDTATLDPVSAESKITPRTRCIVPVQLYGQAANMDAIMALAAAYGLLVVEDNAQSLGAHYRGRKVGSFGHASTMSFYPGKNLGAAGDGGAIAFQDPEVAARARALADHGRWGDAHDFVGYNSRLDALQAAALDIKLGHLDAWNARRREIAAIYERSIHHPDLRLPVTGPERDHIFHLYVVRHPARDELRQALSERGIETRLHYPTPIHLLEPYRHLGEGPGSFPVAETWAQELFSLPMCPTLADEGALRVAEAIEEILGERLVRAHSTT